MVVGLVVAAGLLRVAQPITPVGAITTLGTAPAVGGSQPSLPWPSAGSGAVSVESLGLVASMGSSDPAPAYSVAKVMLAVLVLQDKPLALGDQGPNITVDDADVTDYKARLANGESVIAVQAGETLSEYQALEALLLPSANNVAAILAKWDAGGTDQMVRRLNGVTTGFGLTHTVFADVAGVSVSTVSTPHDMIQMGGLALSNPVLAQIVGQSQATLPVVGVVTNVDKALGQNGIIGVKTGSTTSGSANFLFAGSVQVQGRSVTIIGALMGQPSLTSAFTSAAALVVAVQKTISVLTVINQGEAVAVYKAPWGGRTDLIAQQPVQVLGWPGMVGKVTFQIAPLTDGVPAGLQVGSVTVTIGQSSLAANVATEASIPHPSPFWRLLRN